ncbi:hypothetical protein F5I97DRAFT_1925524 [Phlebopus sp. FC_14]|nr:hypothetical protein F5I97DRAFT_1925524 [Phlebopus sp. FC_14]
MERLTQEEVEQFKREAEEWNKQKPPAEVQSIKVAQKGEDFACKFTKHMWQQCGMRVFILSTWQDNNAKVMVIKHDFNDEFGSGDAFSGHAKVEKK